MLHHLTIILSLLANVSAIDKQVEKVCEFLWEEVIEEPNASTFFTLSIAAPEVIRFHRLSDLMEVQALRLLYADLGSDKVDFSVGLFQMKPSFIEELEKRLKEDLVLSRSFEGLIEYAANSPAEIRASRIDRILDPCQSQQYLKAFVGLMQKEHQGFLSCATDEAQVRFLATAYNLGFGYSTKAILDYQKQQNFPHGPKFQGQQNAFGTYSVKIYNQLNNMLCASNF